MTACSPAGRDLAPVHWTCTGWSPFPARSCSLASTIRMRDAGCGRIGARPGHCASCGCWTGRRTTDQISSLSTAGTAALGTAQTVALTKAQIAVLTTAQVAAIKPADIMVLTIPQIAALTPAQIAALAGSQIAALTTADRPRPKTCTRCCPGTGKLSSPPRISNWPPEPPVARLSAGRTPPSP